MADNDKDRKLPIEDIEQEVAEEVLRKYDAEARVRNLQGLVSKVLTATAVIMSVFHLYMAGLGTMPTNQQRMIHLGLTMVIIFLLYPFRKGSHKGGFNPLDGILAVVSLGVNLYLLFSIDTISANAGLVSDTDIIMGFITIVLVLEAAGAVSAMSCHYLR